MNRVDIEAVGLPQAELETEALEWSEYFLQNQVSTLQDVFLLSKIRTHEKRLEKLEQKYSKDSENIRYEKERKKPALSEKGQNLDNIFLQHYEKLCAYIDALRDREYIEDQFQHTTPILMEIDEIFELYSASSDQFRKQLILKLRSALKLNCLEQLFTDAQITLLLAIVERLRAPVVKKQDVLDTLDELMDCGLSPFPELEEEERENETFSGHDDSN